MNHQTNLNISQSKMLARANLLGNFRVPVYVLILSDLITSLIFLPFSTMLSNGAENRSVYQLVVGALGAFIVLIIAGVLNTGQTYIQLKIARREKHQISDILYPFKNHPDKFIVLTVILLVISIACLCPGMILLALSGDSNVLFAAAYIVLGIGLVVLIIIALCFGLAQRLLLDHTFDLKPGEALRRSHQLMKGKKRKLFGLYLSFIGLYILGVVSFGIGLLWVQPYVSQSISVFYLNAVNEALPEIV